MTTYEPGVHVIAFYTNHGNECYKSVNHEQPVSLETNFHCIPVLKQTMRIEHQLVRILPFKVLH